MDKQDFLKRCRKYVTGSVFVSDDDYYLIETVYEYHPSIKKDIEKIAFLFSTFGMLIISDMYERAIVMKKLEDKLIHAKNEVKRIEEDIKRFNYILDIKDKTNA